MSTVTAEREAFGALQSADLLIRRLKAVTILNTAEIDLLGSIRQRPRTHAPGSQIMPDGDGSPHPRLITSGWACRPRMLPDGRCQLLSILLPGDVVGDGGEHRPLALTPAIALTKVRTINASRIFTASARHPEAYSGLRHALTRLERMEEQQLLDHVVRLGRQTAVQRVAHCLLELYHRANGIGFVHGGAFSMPLTQELLGDALGLSLVHVNRVLGHLKRDGLIHLKAGVLTVLDASHLAHVGDFLVADTNEVFAAAH